MESERSMKVRKDAFISIQSEPTLVALRGPSFHEGGFESYLVLLRIPIPLVTGPMRVSSVATGHTR